MKTFLIFTLLPLFAFSQSIHTISFTGNSTDFNSAKKYNAADDVEYYATYDAIYLYLAAFRVTAQVFGDYDHFTIYVDADPNSTPTAGTDSTTGVSWDSNTPRLPFSANN